MEWHGENVVLQRRRGGGKKVSMIPCAFFCKEEKMTFTVNVLPFGWVILWPHCCAGPGSAHRVLWEWMG